MSKAENIAQKYFHDPFITPPRVAKEKNVYHVWDDLTYAMMLSWEFEYLAAIESDRYIELYFQSGERLKNKPPSVYKDLRDQPKEMADTILRNIFSDNFNELMNYHEEHNLVILAAVFISKFDYEGKLNLYEMRDIYELDENGNYWKKMHAELTLRAAHRADKLGLESNFRNNGKK